MNVMPGDVAIVIKGRWPNVGRIVQVERAWGDVHFILARVFEHNDY